MAQIPQHTSSLLGITMLVQRHGSQTIQPCREFGRFAGLLTVLAVVDLIDQKDIVKGFARCPGVGPSLKGRENL